MPERWPRLTQTLTGPKHPGKCQACGREGESDGNGVKEETVDRWQECDDFDRPEQRFVNLCRPCSDKLIEPHPRLYQRLPANKPIPGNMGLCVNYLQRDGISCRSPLLSANGGPGMKIVSSEPGVMFIDGQDKKGRRIGYAVETYSRPPRDCAGLDEYAGSEEETAYANCS